jgi:hypothetical protein
MEYLFVIFKKTFPAFITSLKYSKVSTFFLYQRFFYSVKLIVSRKESLENLAKIHGMFEALLE